MIVFAVIAQKLFRVPLYICNEVFFGYIMEPMSEGDILDLELDKLYNLKLMIFSQNGGKLLKIDDEFEEYDVKYRSNVSDFSNRIDHIFVINLKRRFQRRKRMQSLMAYLKFDVEIFDAFDGK